jgi:tetratricopeptide (TPR) repeat protein
MTIEETFASALKNHQDDNLEVAQNLYEKILNTNPDHFGSIFYLGALFAKTSNFQEAKKLFKKAIEIQPNFSPAHTNLGSVFQKLGELQQAVNCCKKAIEIAPMNPIPHANLGAILKDLGEFEKAITCCKKAIEIAPSYTSSYHNLALIFQELSEIQKAIDCYEELKQIEPNSLKAHQNLGRLYVVLGNTQKAINSYQEALKYEPENLQYYYDLISLNKEILNSNLKNKINEIIKNKNCTKNNLAYGSFLLAKYEHNEKKYEKEFNYLLEGHRYYFDIKNKKYQNDVGYWLYKLPETKELFDFNKANVVIKEINHKIKPIFIVGVPRCGSTLVEKIITSGVQNIPAGEETGILSTFVKKKIIENQSLNLGIEEFQIKLFEKYNIKRLIKEESNYTFTDKTLDNFFYIGLIKQIFPQAKVINCRRSALSSIMSILKNNLPGVPWAHNLEHIFKYFNIYNKIIDNFNKIFPSFIYELELEKLSNEPVEESKKLMKFCDLTWDNKCLEFYKRKDLISKTTSNLQIRKAIYKHSLEKDLPYKQFLNGYGDSYSWFK